MAEVTTRIIQDSGLSASEKLVYLYIAADFRTSYQDPIRYGSTRRIAEEINFCDHTVRAALRKLEEVSLIKVVERAPYLSIKLLKIDNGYNTLRQLAGTRGR